MAFGQTVADSASNMESWIKGFKPGETRVRIAQELPQWIKYVQHFNGPAFYFPCSTESDCVGCVYPAELNEEGEPRKSWQYAFNAVDEKGNLGIYRLGSNAFKILQSRHQRLGTITDRDYVIVRTGKGFDTQYIPEPGDKYDVDLPTDLRDILKALELKYEEARQATLKAIDDGSFSPVVPTAGSASKTPYLEQIKKGKEPEAPEQPAAGNEDFDSMKVEQLTEFLNAHDVVIPPRASRAKLIALAVEASTPF